MMKVSILAGGKGTRFAERTSRIPKPMIEVGEEPVLMHIMRYYASFGMTEFYIALGYKGDVIKKYFVDLRHAAGDLSIDFSNGTLEMWRNPLENWKVHLIDTGLDTGTGGRIRKLIPYMGNKTFMLTWGDGVSDVDLNALFAFHRSHGRLATMTAVPQPARFGRLTLDGDRIAGFKEKPTQGEGFINGAFFVLEPEVAEFIDGDETMFEQAPLERLAKAGQLMAYRHTAFWQCMDTIRDHQVLQTLWENDRAPWKRWS